MQITKQLAIFLDNEPGMLARVCHALADAKVNIYAISASDTVDHTVIRMVVDNPKKALFVFEERGTLVVEDEHLEVTIEQRGARHIDRPPSLRKCTGKLVPLGAPGPVRLR